MLENWLTIGAGIALVISVVVNGFLSRYLIERHLAVLKVAEKEKELAEQRVRLAEERVRFTQERATALEADRQTYNEYRAAIEESRQLISHTLIELRDCTGIARLRHIQKLGMEGSRAIAAVPILRDLFDARDASPGVKWHILLSMSKISPSSLDALIAERALRDQYRVIRAYAAHLATRRRSDEVSRALQAAATDSSEEQWVAQFYYRALGRAEFGGGLTPPEQDPILAYVFVKAATTNYREIFDDLERLRVQDGKGLIEAGAVQGDHDFILKVIGPHKDSIDEFVMSSLQSLPWVEGTHTFFAIGPPQYFHWIRRRATGGGDRPPGEITWVLVRVPVAHSGGVVVCAAEIANVVEAITVFGEADVIIKVQGDNEQTADQAIAQFRSIPYAERTESYRLVTGRGRQYLGPPLGFQYPQSFILD